MNRGHIKNTDLDEIIEEEVPAPIPFDDSGRESGIRGLAQDLKPNKYEDEFQSLYRRWRRVHAVPSI